MADAACDCGLVKVVFDPVGYAPGSLVIRLIADDSITRHAHPYGQLAVDDIVSTGTTTRIQPGNLLETEISWLRPIAIRSNGHE
jgi:hypothetical protein